MQYSGNNKNQVDGLGEEYIDDDPKGYNMQEIKENLKDLGLRKKIIAEAHENGDGAEYREDIKKVVIESDKNFKMSVPVKKNHAVRFSNVTTEQKEKIKQEEIKECIDSIIRNAVQKSEEDEKNKQVDKQPYQPRGNLPIPVDDDDKRSDNESQEEYEIINSEKEDSKDDIYNQNEKESNNNKSKKSQNSINSDEHSIEEI